MRSAFSSFSPGAAGAARRYRLHQTAAGQHADLLRGRALVSSSDADLKQPTAESRVHVIEHVLQSQSGLALTTLTDADHAEFSHVKHVGARGRSLVARALLRRALSETVDGSVHWHEWAFERSENGKPVLRNHLPHLHFSCTHTHWASAVAISVDGPIGIDLEPSEISFDESMVESYFSRRERQAVNSLPLPNRSRTFTKLWTLKEAYLKLTGHGLSDDLRRIEFDLSDDGRAIQPSRGTIIACSKFKTWQFSAGGRSLTAALAMGRG